MDSDRPCESERELGYSADDLLLAGLGNLVILVIEGLLRLTFDHVLLTAVEHYTDLVILK